jgi:hypothetical protein
MNIKTLSLVALAAPLMLAATSDAPRAGASRAFEFTYTIRVKDVPSDAKSLRIWVPVPASDGQQEVTDLVIKGPVEHQMRQEKEYGDHDAYLELDPGQFGTAQEITMVFKATRHENRVDLESAPRAAAAPAARAELKRSLAPDRLVPLDGVIADLSRSATKDQKKPLDKARAIYKYVLSTMRYDKTGEGWGKGDAIFACNAKRGNCTDFHALFIGMMRAAGIPARFEIGFPLPRDKSAGEIGGYHCWAQFYVDGPGWVPVDASEAWKDPSRRDYFFGAHDANRILFSRGRDIHLDPPQQGEPLNYFVYPYAELDGKPWTGLQTTFSFRDLSSS